jgi:uncharacterized membrane protein
MAKDVGDMVRDSLSQVVREAAQSLSDGDKRKSNGALSGMRGVAAGAGLAALAPVAAKGAGRALRSQLASRGAKGLAKKPGKAVSGAASTVSDATSKVGDSVGGVGEKAKEKAGDVGGAAKKAGKKALPVDRGSREREGGETAGVGKGRRMPVQQSCDVAAPLETVYNQFTQFEEWPSFMHRVTRVAQEDECTVSFATKIWGVRKRFTANIETQRPDERIKWRVAEGITHTGVVSFHELAPRLTRIELTFDVDPGSLIEKFARGARHVKRAARADLHRFKAFIELQEHETGAWRGVIEDGELVKDHPDDYDQGRGDSDLEDTQEPEEEAEDAEEPEEEGDQESQRARTRRFERQLREAGSGRSRSRTRAASSGSGTSRSASGRSTSRSGSSRGGSESRSGRSGGQRKKSSNRR